ncbi:MAG TPA: hypothetical protein DD381_05245 [Lentisphaeria bacterium]|nr:MAG: hypothetical protein A2X47_06170 [Lentisphaerae bacterium GWF2_38_69]HBM15737.1 hypothetical protein [Lentisphaeria bacterium]
MRRIIGKLSPIIIIFLFLFITSCSSTNSPVDPEKIQKITTQEQAELCTFAKKVLVAYNEGSITKEEKKTIILTEPRFTANYFSDKAGNYYFSWVIKGKTINYMGNGDMTDPQKSFDRVIIITTAIEPARK